MDPVPGREGELGALAIILVSVCAYLLLELEWRQLLTRPVSRSCQDRHQGGVCLFVHVCRYNVHVQRNLVTSYLLQLFGQGCVVLVDSV